MQEHLPVQAFILFTGLATVLIALGRRYGIKSNVMVILCGALVGPHVLGIVPDQKQVEWLAKLGVIFLMFGIGHELRFHVLVRMWKKMLFYGSVQMTLTIVVIFAVHASWFPSASWQQALFVGMLVAMSSTAVVLETLRERGEIKTPHGQALIATLIFQDLAVVVLMLATRVLGGESNGTPWWESLGRSILVVVGLLVVGRYCVGPILRWAYNTGRQEGFQLALIALAGAAGLATYHFAGLSPAIGAFIAGVVVADTDFRHHATADIRLPRNLLVMIFFGSIGMLLDFSVVWNSLGWVCGGLLLVVFVKMLCAAVGPILFGSPVRVTVIVGTMLAQIGEFSFVLAEEGRAYDLIDDQFYQVILAIAVISIVITEVNSSWIAKLLDRWGHHVLRLPWMQPPGVLQVKDESVETHNPVVIVGHGVTAKQLTLALKEREVGYTVVELNQTTVARLFSRGVPVVWGDCSHEKVLRAAGVEQAKVVLFAISDSPTLRPAIELARRLAPDATIIARCRFYTSRPELRELGADRVVDHETASALALAPMLLRGLNVDAAEIDPIVDGIREQLRDAPAS